MQFCVDVITCAENLRPHNGILSSAALAVTSDASEAATAILEHAHAEAKLILAKAHDEASVAVLDAEKRVIARADALLMALENERSILLDRAQGMVIDLAQAMFDRLVAEMSPREKVEAVFQRVLMEAPSKLINPQLRVNPADVEFLPVVEWEVKPDASLARGSCRLEASTGEWYADFDAAVLAIKVALVKAVDVESGVTAKVKESSIEEQGSEFDSDAEAI